MINPRFAIELMLGSRSSGCSEWSEGRRVDQSDDTEKYAAIRVFALLARFRLISISIPREMNTSLILLISVTFCMVKLLVRYLKN